ncbi:UNVERIFIED_CONTAM: hypothetical protein FKN15_067012 [Acipenser sinensis]
MAVTRGGGRVGVWTFPLSEWLGGGSWGDCWPYKIMLCCFLRSAFLDALDVRKVLVGSENQRRRRSDLRDRERNRESGEHFGRPRVVCRRA